ncbi:MAG: DUF1989 domain-containing protein [Pseudomonadota bacterium]
MVRLAPRRALRLSLQAGDLISLTGEGADLRLLVLSASGAPDSAALGLALDTSAPPTAFDRQELDGWASSRGLDAAQLTHWVKVTPASHEPVMLRAARACCVWLVRPMAASAAVAGSDAQDVEISVRRTGLVSALPEPLGEVVDAFTISRGTARAYDVQAGQYVQIIDVDGQQCSDFMAFRTDALDRGQEQMIDSTATRSMVRQAYPQPGLLDKFFDPEMRPMLQVVQDTCGRHDTFGLACTARGYEERGFPGHLNCSDNISNAMDPFGVARRSAWPAINFFWNTWIDPDTRHLQTEESHSRPGDYVAMRALTDLVCVSTACPDDIDPINGWNPTDIHVRIYAPEAPIRRAVAYRPKEDTAMTISRESAFHARTSALTQDLAPARDLWVPQSFPATGTLGEYWACREAVTLQDMSPLRKYDIVGPDAEHVLQRLLTRDMSRLALWRGTYALMCDETGAVVDDGTLFRLGPHLFRWCCGTEESARRIEALAERDGLQIRLTDMSDSLANLALQGPLSREVLSQMVFTQPHVPALSQMKWFGVTIGRLGDREGVPFMVSRTGYTGELGYELFCAQSDALHLWDALMDTGARSGIQPMGMAALEIVRIEAGLAAPGAEFGPGHDALEAGLGFAVDLRKSDFVGREALDRNMRDPRRCLKGLRFAGHDVPRPGAGVYHGERQIGEITSATQSPSLNCAIAMARLAVEFAETGTALDVGQMDGRMKRLPATVVEVPFVDPKRTRARA